jgi:hypothetical protein
MVLILRKCKKDGGSSNGFFYGQVGATVTAPVWDPTPECGHGLHGLKQGNGDWLLLEGDDWLVIESNKKNVVDIDDCKCKFRTGKILYRGEKEGLHKYASVMATESQSAYHWAREIGDREIMIGRVTDSLSAYCWAKQIGDREIMIDRVTEPTYAYYWARNIGDRKIMIDRVTDSKLAYFWAFDIGNRDIMIDRVTESQYAYLWAKDIGDREIMRDRITDPYWIKNFNKLPN